MKLKRQLRIKQIGSPARMQAPSEEVWFCLDVVPSRLAPFLVLDDLVALGEAFPLVGKLVDGLDASGSEPSSLRPLLEEQHDLLWQRLLATRFPHVHTAVTELYQAVKSTASSPPPHQVDYADITVPTTDDTTVDDVGETYTELHAIPVARDSSSRQRSMAAVVARYATLSSSRQTSLQTMRGDALSSEAEEDDELHAYHLADEDDSEHEEAKPLLSGIRRQASREPSPCPSPTASEGFHHHQPPHPHTPLSLSPRTPSAPPSLSVTRGRGSIAAGSLSSTGMTTAAPAAVGGTTHAGAAAAAATVVSTSYSSRHLILSSCSRCSTWRCRSHSEAAGHLPSTSSAVPHCLNEGNERTAAAEARPLPSPLPTPNPIPYQLLYHWVLRHRVVEVAKQLQGSLAAVQHKLLQGPYSSRSLHRLVVELSDAVHTTLQLDAEDGSSNSSSCGASRLRGSLFSQQTLSLLSLGDEQQPECSTALTGALQESFTLRHPEVRQAFCGLLLQRAELCERLGDVPMAVRDLCVVQALQPFRPSAAAALTNCPPPILLHIDRLFCELARWEAAAANSTYTSAARSVEEVHQQTIRHWVVFVDAGGERCDGSVMPSTMPFGRFTAIRRVLYARDQLLLQRQRETKHRDQQELLPSAAVCASLPPEAVLLSLQIFQLCDDLHAASAMAASPYLVRCVTECAQTPAELLLAQWLYAGVPPVEEVWHAIATASCMDAEEEESYSFAAQEALLEDCSSTHERVAYLARIREDWTLAANPSTASSRWAVMALLLTAVYQTASTGGGATATEAYLHLLWRLLAHTPFQFVQVYALTQLESVAPHLTHADESDPASALSMPSTRLRRRMYCVLAESGRALLYTALSLCPTHHAAALSLARSHMADAHPCMAFFSLTRALWLCGDGETLRDASCDPELARLLHTRSLEEEDDEGNGALQRVVTRLITISSSVPSSSVLRSPSRPLFLPSSLFLLRGQCSVLCCQVLELSDEDEESEESEGGVRWDRRRLPRDVRRAAQLHPSSSATARFAAALCMDRADFATASHILLHQLFRTLNREDMALLLRFSIDHRRALGGRNMLPEGGTSSSEHSPAAVDAFIEVYGGALRALTPSAWLHSSSFLTPSMVLEHCQSSSRFLSFLTMLDKNSCGEDTHASKTESEVSSC